MDDFVVSLLNKWNLPELIETFREQKIDEDTFVTLTEADLKELIPLIGVRRRFLNNFNNFILERCLVEKSEIIFEEERPITSSPSPSTSSCISEKSNESLVVANTSAKDLMPVQYYSPKATVGLPYVIEPVPAPSNSIVKKLIETTEDGKLIAASYGAQKAFLRNKLSELIIKNELKRSEDKRISSERFKQLAKEIYDIFPHENPEIYYVPYVKDFAKKPKAARGKLWNTYIYMRGKYRELGFLSKNTETRDRNADGAGNTELIDDQIIWLKNNSQPYETVKEYWLNTSEARSKLLSEINIDTYYNTFRILKEPIGYTLLELDFIQNYPDKENIFYTRWPVLAKVIYKLVLKKRDSFMTTLLSEYEQTCNKSLNNPDDFNDSDELFILTILPLFFTSVNLKCKKTNKWKPSRIEIRQGFILHVKVLDAADLEIQTTFRQNKYQSYGYTAQPVPIIVGPLHAIEASYVNVNNIFYKVETPLKAVDLCFKIYHSLNAEYPPEAAVVWTYVEKGIFGIENSFTQKFVAVSTLISDIKQIMENTL